MGEFSKEKFGWYVQVTIFSLLALMAVNVFITSLFPSVPVLKLGAALTIALYGLVVASVIALVFEQRFTELDYGDFLKIGLLAVAIYFGVGYLKVMPGVAQAFSIYPFP